MSKVAPVSWRLVANTARRYWSRRRYRAGARALLLAVLCRYGYELCQECGRRYDHFLWWAPSPLWDELVGTYSGLLCPRCFDRLADAAGIRTVWAPMVCARDGVATTNHWHDPVRDRLLMGEPDPGYHAGGLVNAPQGPWGPTARCLGWTDLPSYYPAENRAS